MRLPRRSKAVPAVVSLFSSPGLQAGVRSDSHLQAALAAFLFSASALAGPVAEATFQKPAEAGWEIRVVSRTQA